MKLVILAGGKGTRLGSEQAMLPKVLRKACGKSLISYVLDYTSFIPKEDITVIVGYMREKVMEAYPELNFVYQAEQKGTGHAVMCAEEAFKDYDGDIMVVNGDMPLIKKETLDALCNYYNNENIDCALLTAVAKDEIPPYGRIIRDENGNFVKIVEQKDATEEQRKIREVNVGVYIFKSKPLFEALKSVRASSATGELYLTDVPEILNSLGYKANAFAYGDEEEFLGVNTIQDLEKVEEIIGRT